MKRKLFDKTLSFEINVMGYKNRGESIVFFLKADDKAVYAGLVDCYEDESKNAALALLKEEKVKYFNHASRTADYLINKFNQLGLASPAAAVTTVYRIHDLPDKEVLKKYIMWGNNVKVYSTGDIENPENDTEKNGIIRTSFDILEQKEIPIETRLLGNAVYVNDRV